MPKNAVVIKDLLKTYSNSKTALDHISLEIPQGSFFGLLGPNGAGKSTLINILAGTVIKTDGKVIINNVDIDDDARGARYHIGIVPQELILDPFFTPREALEYTAGYYGITKKDRRTDEILKAVGLYDKRDAPARSLSGGMKRRLLVAKALVHSPKILVLDEPTAGVDVELRTRLWEYVRTLNKNGTTILLTTHYLEEAEQLCDSLAVIDHGKIIVNDTKKNIVKLLDSKKVIITPKTKVTSIPAIIKQHDNITADLNVEGQIEISYKPSKTSMSEILALVTSCNIEFKDISTSEADLEDVFRFLTAKSEAA